MECHARLSSSRRKRHDRRRLVDAREHAGVIGAFTSLRNYNYRLWAAGAIVSNIGTWMQRTAQAWLVLAQLTKHNASAVGIVFALQFAPFLLLLPLTGFAADHFNQRKLLLMTQSLMGLLTFALGVLTIAGRVELWHVYIFAFLFGCVAAFDSPVRQTFVGDLVGDGDLSNAVALNSTSFNAGRMIGPAVAGLLIATIGTGWAFLFNGLSFVAAIAALYLMRIHELRPGERAVKRHGSLVEGLRYVYARPDLRAIMLMVFFVGTFGLNFPIFLSTMAVSVFHAGAGQYGLLSSVMAIGTVAGALLAARRKRPQIGYLLAGAFVFGIGCTIAAVMPSFWLFAATLIVVGLSAQTLTTTANSTIQMSTDRTMRGRVMALYSTIALGGTPIGAPIAGWVADTFGPRWSLGVGAASGFIAALVALLYLVKYRQLRITFDAGQLRVHTTSISQSASA